MTNREKFKDVFGKDIKWSSAIEPQILALKSAHIDRIDCMEEWLNAEYKESTTKNDIGVDCISRKAVLEITAETGALETQDRVKALPSVTPIRPKGHWIDGHCSECGCDVPAYIVDWKWQKDMDAKFCPNCGADMRI